MRGPQNVIAGRGPAIHALAAALSWEGEDARPSPGMTMKDGSVARYREDAGGSIVSAAWKRRTKVSNSGAARSEIAQ
jgi:hypothetical protein